MDRRTFLKIGSLAAGTCGMNSVFSDVAEFKTDAAERSEAPRFQCAEPVWAAGREREMNVTLGFSTSFEIPQGESADCWILRMTGSTIARVTVNGKFVGYGPARGPHGWFRIDEWKLSDALKTGTNVVLIEIAGYNSNSYYLLDQPSFLQAEIVAADGSIVAATGTDVSSSNTKTIFRVFDATGVRLQKVQRFSFQRPFIEIYDLRRAPSDSVKLARQPEVKYLPRRVPYPEFALIEPVAYLLSGRAEALPKLENTWRDRSLTDIGPKLKGYKIDELELILSDKIQRLETKLDTAAAPKKPESVYAAGDVQIVDFGANDAGFFAVELDSLEDGTELAVTFDEILSDSGDVNFLRLGTCSAILWMLPKSDGLSVLAFEPHVGRYAKIHCLKGSFKLNKFALREYAYPPTREATFAAEDTRLDKLFAAASLTFRTNSVDAFTDCPHRERAGWLCDSFFTARTAFDLTGKTDVEQAFLENYMLPEKFEYLPDGMLPMCYPADHNDGIFIPNWALWFVAELAEYARRSPDSSTVEGLRVKIEKLMNFFAGYENSDGLLEKLPSWIFVEWSAANNFVRDVNYPSNMLYAAALDAAGSLYGVSAWRTKAEKIRHTVIEQSYDGEFFVDNALRKEDGSLEITRNRSEVCQYFAFFFGTATSESHPKLWQKLLDEFGPNRIKDGLYPEIHKANSFVGNVLRLELLSWADRSEQLLEESVAYNEYMADRTGTLWENDGPYASCNHGFASHVAHVLYRDVLGIAAVDPLENRLTIRFRKFDNLKWAQGAMPIPGGVVKLRWEVRDGKIAHSLSVPPSWRAVVEYADGLQAAQP